MGKAGLLIDPYILKLLLHLDEVRIVDAKWNAEYSCVEFVVEHNEIPEDAILVTAKFHKQPEVIFEGWEIIRRAPAGGGDDENQ